MVSTFSRSIEYALIGGHDKTNTLNRKEVTFNNNNKNLFNAQKANNTMDTEYLKYRQFLMY